MLRISRVSGVFVYTPALGCVGLARVALGSFGLYGSRCLGFKTEA